MDLVREGLLWELFKVNICSKDCVCLLARFCCNFRMGTIDYVHRWTKYKYRHQCRAGGRLNASNRLSIYMFGCRVDSLCFCLLARRYISVILKGSRISITDTLRPRRSIVCICKKKRKKKRNETTFPAKLQTRSLPLNQRLGIASKHTIRIAHPILLFLLSLVLSSTSPVCSPPLNCLARPHIVKEVQFPFPGYKTSESPHPSMALYPLRQVNKIPRVGNRTRGLGRGLGPRRFPPHPIPVPPAAAEDDSHQRHGPDRDAHRERDDAGRVAVVPRLLGLAVVLAAGAVVGGERSLGLVRGQRPGHGLGWSRGCSCRLGIVGGGGGFR